jgi:hypothetical protein
VSNDPDYEATQRERRAKRQAAIKATAEQCICCGKPRCDGHDGDAWKRCAKRYREWSLQTERRCLALLAQHGIAPPDGTRAP